METRHSIRLFGRLLGGCGRLSGPSRHHAITLGDPALPEPLERSRKSRDTPSTTCAKVCVGTRKCSWVNRGWREGVEDRFITFKYESQRESVSESVKSARKNAADRPEAVRPEAVTLARARSTGSHGSAPRATGHTKAESKQHRHGRPHGNFQRVAGSHGHTTAVEARYNTFLDTLG